MKKTRASFYGGPITALGMPRLLGGTEKNATVFYGAASPASIPQAASSSTARPK